MLAALLSLVLAVGPLDPPSDVMPPSPIGDHRVALDPPASPPTDAPVILISAPGSYFLTGNLIGTAANNGIEIAANNVSLDLRGFGVIGVPGSLDGIVVTGANRVNIRIHNGTVRGWGGDGIDALNAVNANLHDLQCAGNSGNGIWIRGGNVSASQTRGNAGSGIVISGNTLVGNCLIEGNGTHGVSAVGAAWVQNSTISSNAVKGVEAGFGSFIANNTISGNLSHGIDADGPATKVCHNLVQGNAGHGIVIGNQVMVRDNFLYANGGGVNSNIHLEADRNHVQGNVVNTGVHGIRCAATADFNFISQNTVFANTTGYTIGGTNFVGTITSSAAATGAWVNFNF